MSRLKLSPYPDSVVVIDDLEELYNPVIDDLEELYNLAERIDTLAMRVRDQRGSQDASFLSIQATICRLETAAQILRSLQ